MKSIMVSSLKAGMVFTKAVYIEGNNILVPPDIPLKQKDIDRLRSWNILEVFSEGEIVSSAETEAIINNAREYKKEEDLSFYDNALKNMDNIFQNVENNLLAEQDQATVDNVANEIYKHIKKSGSPLIQKILATKTEQKNLTISSVNCAILSAIIGLFFLKDKDSLLDLIIAALLHDTGMLQVSDSILLKQEKLTAEDIQKIRQHTSRSFSIIKKMGYSDKIAQTVLYHHEKWNGTGYPSRKKAAEIPLESRIIAVADTYVALVNSRPYRSYLIGYSAMRAILSDNGVHFDPAIIKVFLKSIGIYPIGSIVKLSDQSLGKITDINSKTPLRPKILLVKDSAGRAIKEKRIIDLMEKQDLFITKAIDPKTIEGI